MHIQMGSTPLNVSMMLQLQQMQQMLAKMQAEMKTKSPPPPVASKPTVNNNTIPPQQQVLGMGGVLVL